MQIRKGYCNPKKCNAACCRSIQLITPAKLPDDVRVWLFGFGINTEDNEMGTAITFKSNCKHLDTKTLKCKIYDKRYDICIRFPWEPRQIRDKKCSYYFKEKLIRSKNKN